MFKLKLNPEKFGLKNPQTLNGNKQPVTNKNGVSFERISITKNNENT